MNEHIIVTENNPKVLKHIIKVNKISKISEYDNNGKKCAILHFIDGLDIDEGYAAMSTINELRVLETVNELETLIMGPKLKDELSHLAHSNPDNPCCLETFKNCRQLYLTDPKKELPFPDAVKFASLRDIWQIDFLRKIQESLK